MNTERDDVVYMWFYTQLNVFLADFTTNCYFLDMQYYLFN